MKSYDAGPTDTPILEETIGANFERTVLANPDAEALVDVDSDRRWTYGELNDDIDLVARGLMSLGIEPGERVGIWAPNCPEWTIVQYATAKIGAVLVNINPAYRTHELAYVLKQSGIRTLISAIAFKTADYVSMVDEVRADTPDLREVLFLGTDDWTHLRNRAVQVSEDELRAASRPWTTTSPSTSNTPRGQRDSRKVRRCRTATFSTTGSSLPTSSTWDPATACASRCPSTTASAW
jgi:fatty-acyl-CoA synthase